MFACRDAAHLITEDREGGLSGATRLKFRFHMVICPYCRTFRRQFDETIVIAKEIPAEEVPPEAVERAVEAFRARKGR